MKIFSCSLQTLREKMAGAGSEPEPAPDVTDDHFAAGNLIELPLAAQRVGIHVEGKPR
ncbi:hypothetical protein NMA58_07565 [Rhizobium sp. YTUHZ045]|uniref:hypothetical protein n=1 Tax=Rhizobium sp. YTUHZ045 TaxID=2962888 RepID=UPI003DA8EE70